MGTPCAAFPIRCARPVTMSPEAAVVTREEFSTKTARGRNTSSPVTPLREETP